MPPPATIIIPTRSRPEYLKVALASIREQARQADVEVLVVDDGGASEQAAELARDMGVRYEPHARRLGLNVARNTGVERSSGELVIFVDDDIRAASGWLSALLHAAREHADVDVFTGPIHARLEGRAPRTCGREPAPITSLELGPADRDAEFAWGANMAIRRSALELVGPFDVTLENGGDEQDWQERLRAIRPGARVLYVADAAVEHRRSGRDSELRALCLAAHARGRASRRFDERRVREPSLARELITLGGCVGHVIRRRCPAGMTMAAHSAGRVREALVHGRLRGAPAPAPPPAPADDFLSGASGTVGGTDAMLRIARDEAADARAVLSGRRVLLWKQARRSPPRRSVLALGVARPVNGELSAAIRRELMRSRHHVELHTTAPRELGKFENLNRLLMRYPASGHDWLLLIDDDVELPRGFLDELLFLCERFALVLAQPAHRQHSHAAWEVTRRQPGVLVRETSFVEIGPVTAIARSAFEVLLPFPDLRMGWGLDAHWGAVARRMKWRCGVVDAVAINHRAAPAASAYPREAAIEEARGFLAGRPYVRASEAEVTIATHRRL